MMQYPPRPGHDGGGEDRRGVPSISGLDSDTPVVSLDDPRRFYRRVLVLMDDDERFSVTWSVERVKERINRQMWYETLWGRLALVSGALAGLATAVADIWRSFH